MGKSVLKLKQAVSAGASMGACVCMGDFMILKQANKHNKQVERNTQVQAKQKAAQNINITFWILLFAINFVCMVRCLG